MVARVYAIDGTFAGRLMSVSEFLPNGLCVGIVRDMGGDSEIVIPMEMIEISCD